MPDKTEDDVIKTLELIDDLNDYKAFFAPLLFVPLEKCFLEAQSGAELSSFKVAMEFYLKMLEYNARIWKASFLEERVHNPFLYSTVALCVIYATRDTVQKEREHKNGEQA